MSEKVVNEEKVVKQFVLFAEEKTAKETGNKFYAYKTVAKNGRFMTVKFRKEVKDAPQKEGTYWLKVLPENVSVDTNRQYPVLWVHAIEEIGDYVKTSNVNVDDYI